MLIKARASSLGALRTVVLEVTLVSAVLSSKAVDVLARFGAPGFDSDDVSIFELCVLSVCLRVCDVMWCGGVPTAKSTAQGDSKN